MALVWWNLNGKPQTAVAWMSWEPAMSAMVPGRSCNGFLDRNCGWRVCVWASGGRHDGPDGFRKGGRQVQMSFRFGPICRAADVRQFSDNANVPCPDCNPQGSTRETVGDCERCSGFRWIDPGMAWFWAARKVADEFEGKGYASEKSWEELRAAIRLFERKEGQS